MKFYKTHHKGDINDRINCSQHGRFIKTIIDGRGGVAVVCAKCLYSVSGFTIKDMKSDGESISIFLNKK